MGLPTITPDAIHHYTTLHYTTLHYTTLQLRCTPAAGRGAESRLKPARNMARKPDPETRARPDWLTCPKINRCSSTQLLRNQPPPFGSALRARARVHPPEPLLWVLHPNPLERVIKRPVNDHEHKMQACLQLLGATMHSGTHGTPSAYRPLTLWWPQWLLSHANYWNMFHGTSKGGWPISVRPPAHSPAVACKQRLGCNHYCHGCRQ